MASVEIVDATKHYKQGDRIVKALDGVTLRIEAGEFVAIVGPSGSGKTTLLDCIGLLLRPTTGQVLLDGIDTGRLGGDELAELRSRRIGFVFQEYNLLPTLSALENVMLPLRYGPADLRREGRDRALQLLAEVGLAERASHRPDALSGGEQQRVAIARSLVNQPTLVLGDEPTGNLDTETGDQLLAMMKRMNRDRGVTYLVVTHDLDIAARTDRQIRLRDGRVVADSKPAAATA